MDLHELQTVSTVSKNFGISTRMLRYYEQIGLISSQRKENYSYRVYDEPAVRRLRQIIILRKLRIPVKQIKDLLSSQESAAAIDIFNQNIAELDGEISALSTIRNILLRFVGALETRANIGIKKEFDLFGDESVTSIISSLSLPKNYINTNTKEEFSTMQEKDLNDLNKADEKLHKLTDKDVRIIYLPPATVAASHYIGEDPGHHAAAILDKFVIESNLPEIKPDMREYGFNHPNPGCIEGSDLHGYEFWATIPDDMDVPEPLIKKQFPGGLYAAHMIPIGAFEEWEWLCEWAMNNDQYEPVWTTPEFMGGCLEEHLNYRNNVSKFVDGRYDNIQLDLLIPIKEKEIK